jgi:DNA modification methylase
MNQKETMTLPEPYFETDLGRLYCGDCLEIMPELEFDFVYTDPPYNVGKNYGVYKDKIKDEDYIEFFAGIFNNLSRFIVHIPQKYFQEIVAQLPSPGQLIVIPRQCQGKIFYKTGWTSGYDVLWAYGKTKKRHTPPPNIWNHINLKGEGFLFRENHYNHPGYTPRAIAARAIYYMTRKNDVVLDIFNGTGTTSSVCEYLDRRWIGIEISEEYCRIAKERIKRERSQKRFSGF